MHPYILVTCSRDGENCFLRRSYVLALRRCGAMPVLLPPLQEDCAELCRFAQGLLLSGGGDAAPELYGERRTAFETCDEERDGMELALARCFMEQKKPILGICRGMQMLNIACGGTLYRDLPLEGGKASALPPGSYLRTPIRHAASGERSSSLHTVHLSGQMASAAETDKLVVNSFHHQGVRRLGVGLCGTAYSEDGLCEGFCAEKGFAWGVQWHPEVLDDAFSRELFTAFVLAAARR